MRGTSLIGHAVRFLTLGILVVGCAVAHAADAPRRVASLNLCLDELAFRIASPGQIVALSNLAHDPSLSSIASQILHIPGLDLRGEAVLAARPDLVLADSFSGSATKALLRRHGIAVEELGIADSLDAAAAQAQRIGTLLARPTEGRNLANSMIAEAVRLVGGLPHAEPARKPLAVLWQANRGTQGSRTLPHDLLTRAGLRNLAADLGIEGFATLPIETVLQHRPRLLVVDSLARATGSLAETTQFHPVLRASGLLERIVQVPRRALVCAGPQSLEALQILAETRRELATMRGGHHGPIGRDGSGRVASASAP